MMHTRLTRGLATLESALIVSVLFAVFLGLAATVDYLNRVDAAYESLDRELRNSSQKGLAIRMDSNGPTLIVDAAGVRAFVDGVAQQLVGASVEAGYAVVDIDAVSGVLSGVRPISYRRARGGPPPLASDNCPGLANELVRFANSSSADVPSILAVPDGGTSQIRYLTEIILVAARAEIDLSDAHFTRNTISIMGMNPRATVCSVNALRGDIAGREL